jgi:hypothetical protein
MGIESFACSATQMLNGSCILGVVVGDSLKSEKAARVGRSPSPRSPPRFCAAAPTPSAVPLNYGSADATALVHGGRRSSRRR